jgi:signal transduction histidine kinase
MHYVGMLGYRTEGVIRWDPAYVTASVLIGAVFGVAALEVGRPGADGWRRFAAAGLLSLGIVGMHFTGMAAVTILPAAGVPVSPSTMSDVAMAAAAVGGMALILITVMVGALFGAFSRESNLKRLSEALDVMPEAVGVYDADERLTAWNARFAEYWEEVGSVVVGWTIEDMIRALVAQNVFPEAGQGEAAVAQGLAEFRSGSSLQEMVTHHGRWVRVTHRRTRGGFTVTTAVNISDLKQAGVDMAHARDEAEAANRSKSEFLANMSHEIRTPMNGIMGMNSLMLLSPLTEEQRLYAETVQSSAESLLGILNDILDMSKLEAGKVTLEYIGFSFQELARDVVRSVTPNANEKKIALSYEAPDGRFLGDPGRIRQVLLNLVANGVKFTERGSVDIGIHSRLAGRRAHLRIEVSDTGIGLSNDAKAKLFQPFQQADASITRRFGGTGLGLSICRQLIELMDGRIGVDDHSSGGSTFWFELTLERAQEVAATLRQTG